MSKRRFWQLHLSTAITLMLVANILVLANLHETYTVEPKSSEGEVRYHELARGWPFTAYRQFADPQDRTRRRIEMGLLYDVLFGFVVLCSIAFISERRMRGCDNDRPT
jgi:hypothetical protein